MSRILAKDIAQMVRGMPIMHSAPSKAFAPKTEKGRNVEWQGVEG